MSKRKIEPVGSVSKYLEVISNYRKEHLTVEYFRDLGMVGEPFPNHIVEAKTRNIWFRGQAQDLPLIPKLYRKGVNYKYEKEMMLECRRKALTLESAPAWTDYDSWLFLMQHHGLPTRLLDWTESAGAALYFAVEKWREYKKNCQLCKFKPVVWVVNPNTLNWEEGGTIVPGIAEDEIAVSPGDRDYWFGRGNVFAAFQGDEGIYKIKNKETNKVEKIHVCRKKPLAVASRYVHTRLQVQRSCFTAHGRDKRSLKEIYENDNLVKKGLLAPIYINPDLKCVQGIAEELKMLGISRSTLFPDLEGVARDLIEKFTAPAVR